MPQNGFVSGVSVTFSTYQEPTSLHVHKPVGSAAVPGEDPTYSYKLDPSMYPSGVAKLLQGELHSAAIEFEAARRLMPGHPDPLCNLAIVYEKAGRLEDAEMAFTDALDLEPSHIASIQGLALIRVRTAPHAPHTRELLDDVALRGETRAWREWAARERLKVIETSGM